MYIMAIRVRVYVNTGHIQHTTHNSTKMYSTTSQMQRSHGVVQGCPLLTDTYERSIEGHKLCEQCDIGLL